MNNLKKNHPGLKSLLSVGGGKLDTKSMSKMLGKRIIFVNTCIKYLRDRNFDGLDLAFEYPGSSDKQAYTLLVKVSVNIDVVAIDLPYS